MKSLKLVVVTAGLCLTPQSAVQPIQAASPVVGILQTELQRNFSVLSKEQTPAYFLGYTVHDERSSTLIASLGALERADEIAAALVDGPLDDREIGSTERQLAVVRALDATFPLQSTTIEVELPADGEGVAAMGWEAMQALASRLLEPSEPVPSLYQAEDLA